MCRAHWLREHRTTWIYLLLSVQDCAPAITGTFHLQNTLDAGIYGTGENMRVIRTLVLLTVLLTILSAQTSPTQAAGVLDIRQMMSAAEFDQAGFNKLTPSEITAFNSIQFNSYEIQKSISRKLTQIVVVMVPQCEWTARFSFISSKLRECCLKSQVRSKDRNA
jgi:hypothetical protein